MKPKKKLYKRIPYALAGCLMITGLSALPASAQTTDQTSPPKTTQTKKAPPVTMTSAPAKSSANDQAPITLSPFVVSGEKDNGYAAAYTLAGSRLRTSLKDLGSSISVVNKEMMDDLGATDNLSVLPYVTNAEIGGPRGNYSGGIQPGGVDGPNETDTFGNPNGATRIRGLAQADSTRDFFLTDVPWDSYNTNRIELQRGPNAILAGLGSPAGLINASSERAVFKNQGNLQLKYDKYGSVRASLDYNHEFLKKQLGVRVALLRNNHKYQQKPAFSNDHRVYVAAAFKPEMLNRNGMNFEVSGNFESGKIEGNTPRVSPPMDDITPFWLPVSKGGLDKQTFDPQTATTADNIALSTVTGNGYNPVWYVNSAGPVIGNGDGIDAQSSWLIQNIPQQYGVLNQDGLPQGSTLPDGSTVPVGGNKGVTLDGSNHALLAIDTYNGIAARLGLPFSSLYYPKEITDPSLFDFYNKLIDGNNKHHHSDWKTYNLEVSHTFFNNQFGYDVAYFDQKMNENRWAAMGWSNRIFMDINQTNPDGSPNKNVGRAYVYRSLDQTGSKTTITDRSSYRFQAFVDHDFRRNLPGFLGRLIGRHRITGLISEQDHKRKSWSQKLYAVDPAFNALFNSDSNVSNGIRPTFKYYLSGDLSGLSSPAGADLSNIQGNVLPTASSVPVTYFDTTWIAPSSVSPTDPYTPTGNGSPVDSNGNGIQAENPANYRGWVTKNVNIYSVFNPNEQVPGAGMDAYHYLVNRPGTEAIEDNVKSKVLVWQGYLLNDAIVGLYGWRKDKVMNYNYNQDLAPQDTFRTDGGGNIDSSVLNFHNPNATVTYVEGQSRNWSVAVHANKLLGRHDFLPINVSFYYNEGENFEPAAGRKDLLGEAVAAPSGHTRDVSVLLATKDGKYSLRITKYVTTVSNENLTTGLSSRWYAFQQLFRNNGPQGFYRSIQAGHLDPSTHPEYGTNGSVKPGYIDTIVQDWGNFMTELAQKFPGFVNTYSVGAVNATNPAGSGYVLNGITLTQDERSEGYEFEATANPTRNWRIAFNASKTKAARTNVPGSNNLKVLNFIDNAIWNTPAGLMPQWYWGGQYGQQAGGISQYPYFHNALVAAEALNGQEAPEVRKWRWNLITNYTFDHGPIRGFGVGGGVRWQSSSILGYAPKDVDGATTIDLNKPFKSPSETNYDMWFSYQHKLTDKVDWKIQLNLYNVFGKNKLVPIAVQPDGTPSTYRIQEGMSWALTNTFRF